MAIQSKEGRCNAVSAPIPRFLFSLLTFCVRFFIAVLVPWTYQILDTCLGCKPTSIQPRGDRIGGIGNPQLPTPSLMSGPRACDGLARGQARGDESPGWPICRRRYPYSRATFIACREERHTPSFERGLNPRNGLR